MTNGDAPELLDRGDVAMGGKSWQTVRMDTPLAPLSRADTAFRFLGAYRVTSLSVDRVSTEQGACEFCTGVPRGLDRDALPDGFSSQARKQGTGNG